MNRTIKLDCLFGLMTCVAVWNYTSFFWTLIVLAVVGVRTMYLLGEECIQEKTEEMKEHNRLCSSVDTEWDLHEK